MSEDLVELIERSWRVLGRPADVAGKRAFMFVLTRPGRPDVAVTAPTVAEARVELAAVISRERMTETIVLASNLEPAPPTLLGEPRAQQASNHRIRPGLPEGVDPSGGDERRQREVADLQRKLRDRDREGAANRQKASQANQFRATQAAQARERVVAQNVLARARSERSIREGRERLERRSEEAKSRQALMADARVRASKVCSHGARRPFCVVDGCTHHAPRGSGTGGANYWRDIGH